MEKLREALDKARSDRAATAQQRGATTPPRDTDGGDIWAALTSVSLDEAHLTRHRVVSQQFSREATAFDILRTKIVLQMRRHGWRRLAITSATPACGKTTVTCNLALGLSRQSELRAIVIDFDLRNPAVAKVLGVSAPRDITRLLKGEVSFAEQAVRVRDTVALSLAKAPTPDPTQYLLGPSTQAILSQIETDYAPDLMIFDTAPVMVSDDTRAFLGQVDCAMIVACAEKTTRRQIDICEREIAEHTNVLGVVLNQARFVEPDYDYTYKYGS